MILKKEILEKAEAWKIRPDTVDKDYVLGHFLNSFYSFDVHKKTFIFKGGTCLRKCYFEDYRFSEDLDFTLLDRRFEIKPSFFERIIEHCESITGIRFSLRGLKPKLFDNEPKGYECILSFWGANHQRNQAPPPTERWTTRIKVDIGFDEEMATSAAFRDIHHSYSDRRKVTIGEIPVYSLTEILLEKIRSFFQRSYNAPRDYYDVWYLLCNVPNEEFGDKKRLTSLLLKKCRLKNIEINPDIFEDTDIYKTVKKAWGNSLAHQLSSEKLPDFDAVWSFLKDHLFQDFIGMR